MEQEAKIDISEDAKLEMVHQFAAKVRSDVLLGVKCAGSDRAWMRAVTTNIFLISQSGDVLETVNTQTGTHPNDIFVTENNEVLFTDITGKCITKVTKANSKWTIKPFLKTGNFIPLSLCCTVDEQILVTLILDTLSSANSDQAASAKVVRFGKDSEVVQEIKLNEKGEPLYKNPEYLCVNKSNNDICVSDWGSKAVVVVETSGAFRFSFEGKRSRRYPDFSPRDLTCDSQGRILVVDSGNECIQMLSKDGDFLSYLLTDDNGIEDPFTLSIDTSGRLWVGERFTKKVKVFKGAPLENN